MTYRSKTLARGSINHSEKRPAWIRRRASERPVARWIAWAAKRDRWHRDASRSRPGADAAEGATVIDLAQWRAAHRR